MPSLNHLVQIMAKLRSPEGCPWDREQTHASIVPQLVEEVYEAIDAIEQKNGKELCEELGDILLHIVFHTQLASEEGQFTMGDVVAGICEKLIRRHPHVFGDVKVHSTDDVVANWHEIKKGEKKGITRESELDSVPRSFPALLEAYKISKKASRLGFDWKRTSEVIPKIREEVAELEATIQSKDAQGMEHEAGDLLFSIVNILRHLKIQPEEALRKANGRFRKRFGAMENTIQKENIPFGQIIPQKWDALWNAAKKDG